MRSKPEPEYEYEIADGKVHLRILAATRRTFNRWDGSAYSLAEEIQGRIQISTDRQWGADTDLGFVKVRGRKYAIEHVVRRLPEDAGHLDRHGMTWRWQRESSYRGGYRNDRGSQVSFDAKAWDSLRDIENSILNRFEKEHPDWHTASTRKLFEYERDHLLGKAKRKRDEAAEADSQAAGWQKRIDELG